MKMKYKKSSLGNYELISSEFIFSREVNGQPVILTVYIDYENKSYDIVQNCQEGIFPNLHNKECEINRAYFELALEALELIERELKLKRRKPKEPKKSGEKKPQSNIKKNT